MASKQNKSAAEIEAEINRTRARIEDDVDELGNKVSPSNLADNAKGALDEAQSAVVSTVTDLTHSVNDNAAKWSGSLVDVIKQNPLPAALVGLGIGLLAASGSRNRTPRGDEAQRSWSGMAEPVDYSSGAVSQKQLPARSSYDANYEAEGYVEQAQQKARQAKRGLLGWVEENPLLAGAAVIAVGVGVGLSVPTSSYEDEMMGDTSDGLLNEAKTAIADTVEAAKETVTVAKETAAETIKTLKEETKSKLADVDVKETVKQKVKAADKAVKDVAESATKTAKTTAKQKAEARNLTA